MTRLERDERTFHVFYQLLAGAQPDEREELDLQDPDAYELLASSGCYRLPGGPFSDDSLQFDELRIAMANLGFKAKHLKSIFSVLVTLLLLGNIEFEDTATSGVVMDESAKVTYESREVLEQVAWRLGVPAEELEQGLTNETRYIRKELCSSFLDSRGATRQRDTLVKDLYAILFAFIVETANRKIAPVEPEEDDQESTDTMIVQLELPGYQSKTSPLSEGRASSNAQPLINSTGVNSVDEFGINFANEMLHSYLTRRCFEDQVDGGLNGAIKADGIELPHVVTMDNSACIEMLRGGLIEGRTQRLASRPLGLLGVFDEAGVAIDPERGFQDVTRQDEQLLSVMTRTCGVHASFIPNPPATTGRKLMFGINHYAGACTYDMSHFVERNADIVDAQIVSMLRASSDSFVAKLVSGPSISAEGHPLDDNTVVQAQVSVVPLREPSLSAMQTPALEGSKAYPVTTQLNATMTDILTSLDNTELWHVACIRPNDSGHANSVDKRKVKNQIRSMLLPDMLIRKQVDYVASQDLLQFCDYHGLRFDANDRSTVEGAVRRFASEHGWQAQRDYAVGRSQIWLGYDAWVDVDNAVRAIEGEEEGEDGSPFSDSPQQTPYGGDSMQDPAESYMDGHKDHGGYDESRENLLMTKGTPTRWDSDYKNGMDSPGVPVLGNGYPVEKNNIDEKGFSGHDGEVADMIVHEKGHHAEMETLPTTKARRWWVRITWFMTWWIPSFLLSKVGRMKRPDIQMAWREKFAICAMIGILCGIIIFYIVVFGMLLCPNMNKAWNTSQLTEHGDASSYYAAIHGYVYDVGIWMSCITV
jgi:chitin synthase